MDQKLIDEVLDELDLIFGSREETWDLLLVRFLELIMDEERFTRLCWNKIQSPESLYQFWVSYRRALRKVTGYTIVKGRDPIEGGRKRPLLIQEILVKAGKKAKKNNKITKKSKKTTRKTT